VIPCRRILTPSYLPSSYSYSSEFDDSSFAQDILKGLSLRQKQLNSKYFYDEQGSTLFERICLQPEYYPTRTETDILKTQSRKIIELACRGTDHVNIVELGSGSSIK